MNRLRIACAAASLLFPLALHGATTVVPFTPDAPSDEPERRFEHAPAMVTDGTTAAALWTDGDRRVLLSAIDLRNPVTQPPVVVSEDGVSSAIASSPGQYLVVWNDEAHLMARRYSQALQPLDEPFDIGWSPSVPARVAFNGAEWLVVYTMSDVAIGTTRISLEGKVLAERDPAFDFSFTSYDVDPDVFWDGTAFVVSWVHYDRIRPPVGQKLFASIRRASVGADGELVSPVTLATRDLTENVGPQQRFGSFGPVRVAAGSGRTLEVWSQIGAERSENPPISLVAIATPRRASEHPSRRRSIGSPFAGEVLATSVGDEWNYIPLRTSNGFEVVWGIPRTGMLHRLVIRDDGSREEITTLDSLASGHVIAAAPMPGGLLTVVGTTDLEARLYWIVPAP